MYHVGGPIAAAGIPELPYRYPPVHPIGSSIRAEAVAPLSTRYRQPMVEFPILGPLEVRADDRPVTHGGTKQRATLAILLLNANRVVSVDRIADDLYAGRPPVTAVTQVQRQISDLRRLLGPHSGIETRPPGYRIGIEPGQLDLLRFERLTADGLDAHDRGEARQAAELHHRALELWRGDPLSDLSHEAFAQVAIQRLEEMRVATLEARIEADLAWGGHRHVVAELEALVTDYPYRETFHAQRMLALYRSGRQAEALDAFRSARDALKEGLGLDPSPRLRRLERAILAHDPELEPAAAVARAASTAVLVLPRSDERIQGLVELLAPVAQASGSELVAARLLQRQEELPAAVAALHAARAAGHEAFRSAAFTTDAPAEDVARLVASHDVELIVVDAADAGAEPVSGWLAGLLDRAPVDVAVLAGALRRGGRGVVVPFGGGEHGWAALELGARLAAATGDTLSIAGTAAIPSRRRPDASRLLADASLAVQRVLGIDAVPVLVDPSVEALAALAHEARLIVVGFPERWRVDGVGGMRAALVDAARSPVALVRRGPRPGALVPHASRTSFTWTIERETD